MAKRRKRRRYRGFSFKGTRQEHARAAGAMLKSIRYENKWLKKFLRDGDCAKAATTLKNLAWDSGAYAAERRWTGDKSARGSERVVSGALKRFSRSCAWSRRKDF